MPIQILMPALSPTMEDGTLARWLVKEGDRIASGDVIAEIETDKATMEFEAADDGTLGRILVAEGTAGVTVNTPIAVLLAEGESLGDLDTAAEAPAAPPSADETAPPAAKAAAAAEVAPHGAGEKAAPPAPQGKDGGRLFASPLARRIAADRGIDLSALHGSGPRGRIVRADVDAAEAQADVSQTASPAQPVSAAAPGSATVAPADVARLYADRETREVALDGMRRTIADRLTEAKQTIPHFYLRRDIRLDALLDLRGKMNAQLVARGLKLSVNDFIIKACANALQQVPAANAVWAGDRILELVPSDVAVAVAVEGGLFTPVLRDAQSKSLSALSTEMKALAARARARKLAPQDYQGGSFAISNLGMFGVESFDAVINPPHGAILAVGAGVKKPVVGPDGAVVVATVLSLTLSVDHRVIDGAVGAELLAAIVDGLENPLAILA